MSKSITWVDENVEAIELVSAPLQVNSSTKTLIAAWQMLRS